METHRKYFLGMTVQSVWHMGDELYIKVPVSWYSCPREVQLSRDTGSPLGSQMGMLSDTVSDTEDSWIVRTKQNMTEKCT